MDNRLAFLLHPKFKQKWIENNDEKEALWVLQMHVTSRLGLSQVATAQMMIMEALPKSQSYLTSLQKARKRKHRRIQEEK